ncbi:NADP-dependent oxidoreductase domain-containing protein [Dactylonectria macrodidyma]|uniref:NADP-dependent oxidoreductase domain-containing protein n=1 Tax=Dactylonectria macrodidyma TaxID=307937 RepID=A0A9P9EQM2_9HYPO|nr:NADP-dependent oxidoreductase domain-containing protein [Dactylonectria macrodidyma]
MGSIKAVSGLACLSLALYTLLSLAIGPEPLFVSDHQAEIPSFGLGTWLAEKGKVSHAVEYALKSGYRHIDAAAIYRNEGEVGEGIKASGLSRDDIWVTSKLWNTDHRPELVRKAIEKSIADLGVEYLDLYLIHWPVAFVPGGTELDKDTSIVDTWLALEDLVRANLTRHIGLSNFAPRDIEKILDVATIRPYAHEFETHPYLQQQAFVDFHAEQGIKVIAYSPLANTNPTYDPNIPSILDDPFWKEIAARKNATVVQAVLAWGQQRDTVVIPKSTHEKYIDENFRSQDLKFTDDELAQVAGRDKRIRLNNPGKKWGVDLFEGLDDPNKELTENDEL